MIDLSWTYRANRVVITAANADKAQTVMNAGQKAMWAYRDWLRRPSAELRARAERKRDLYEKHRNELINQPQGE